MNIKQLYKTLLEPYNDTTIVKSIQELNSIFINVDDRLNSYASNPSLVSAYAAFYMPTNIKKLDFILSMLSTYPWTGHDRIEVIDYGCGTGTGSFAIYNYISNDTDVYYHFVDKSEIMLSQAKKIACNMFSDMKTTFNSKMPLLSESTFKILLLGNVIIESGVRFFQDIVKKSSADTVMIMEPGTMESFANISSARRFMLKKKYYCLYPCPSDLRCPVEKDKKEWCHQVLRNSLDSDLERLGQLSGINRKTMPFIGHIYAIKNGDKIDEKLPSQIFRLKKNTKHAFLWQLCTASKTNKIIDVEFPKRGLSKKQLKVFDKICAGQFIDFSPVKHLKNGSLRIQDVILIL